MCTVDVAVGENHAAVSIVSPGAGYLESQTPRAPVERKDRRTWAFSNITGPLQQPGTSPDLLCEVNSLSGWCHRGCVSVAMIWSNLTVTRPEDKSKTKAQESSVAGLLGFSEGVAERPGENIRSQFKPLSREGNSHCTMLWLTVHCTELQQIRQNTSAIVSTFACYLTLSHIKPLFL